jgi:hypothetical protein
MPLRFDVLRRLEPRRPGGSLDEGFRAEVHDPLWLLGRQWQMGEHQGEDAASPIQARATVSQTPLDPYDGDPELDPLVTPAEAIVESGPGDWWTIGRRVRIGLAAAPSMPVLAPAADELLRCSNLPPPYDRCNGSYDGLLLYQQRVALGLPASLFAELPAQEPADLWDPAELVYSARFTTGAGAGAELDLPRHDGGDVDWYSVHGSEPLAAPPNLPPPTEVTPSRLRYPGAPQPRWWQIEDARVDVGGFPPDRGHFATMLLVDLIVAHADDWFSFPLTTRPGNVVTVHTLEVRDAFDDVTALHVPGSGWTLFRVAGLDVTSLLVWPTVATPLAGPALDDVILGVDEDANLLWAIELRAEGRELAPPPPDAAPTAPAPNGRVHADERKAYGYRPSTLVPPYWHPYEIHEIDGRRRFVQARMANLEVRPPVLMPEPVSPLLSDPNAPASGPAHQIEPATIPSSGLRLDRRYVLGRRTDGLPVLWRQRRRLPLLAPPVSGLRFDVLEEQLVLQ